MANWTQVDIDFSTSHLIFPYIVGTILGLLGLAILVTRRRTILASGEYWSAILSKMDKVRFLGMLALTLVYLLLMVPVGNIWPNTGMGFLLCSIPYVSLTGILFLHNHGLRDILPVLVAGVVAPLIVWWMFTELFFLSLP